MKILMLNYEYPPIGGGGGVISKNIAENLADLGHNVTVLTVWFDGLQELEEGEIKVIRLKSLRKRSYRSNPVEMLSWVKQSKKYIDVHVRKKDYNLCFANFVIPGGIPALYLLKKYNIPYVVISHGHDIPWAKPVNLYPLFALNYFRIKRILHKSDLIFLQSNKMKNNCDYFLSERYKHKSCLVSNACDESMFYPDHTKRGDIPNIIFVGRLVKQKDPLTFVRTLRIIVQKGFRFTADIYGDGPLRKRILKLLEKYEMLDMVQVHRNVSHGMMRAKYQAADLMIAPSISEGMSISAIEALFSGVYLMATPVSGFTELIQDSGFGQFINRKPKDIAEKAVHFFNEKSPVSVSRDFRDNYSWKKIVMKYEQHLLSLIDNA